MKKFLIILLGLLVLCAASSASPAFGVRGGLNLANTTQDPSEGYDTKIKMGLMIGGSAEFSLTPSNKTTIRLEGLYVQKGWKEEGDILGIAYDETGIIDELVVAPFLVLRFPGESLTPFIQAGPELGFNLTAKGKVEAMGIEETADLEDWASTNFGINIGGGFAIPSGSGEVILDARYNLGLTNMYTGEGDFTTKTNGIQFMVGYAFGVPEK